jgi:hypothetical protein
MSSLSEIAQQLKDNKENILLIYAFNSTGKTKLSVKYKNLTKNSETGEHAGVYYNAYSEDLFVWDNDEEHNNADIRLKVLPSRLSQFHSFLDGSPSLLEAKLARYNPKYFYKINPHDDPEKGIESITFTLEEGDTPIKISRGEERIFIWCFFLALFEVDAWAGEQDAHFFIDDPVSSLDDHNIFITADSICDIIEENYLKRRIIITTHHIGLYSILFDRLRKGEKSSRYKNLTKPFILTNRDNELELKHHDKDVFLFHLHLMQTLDEATKNKLYLFHFVLLRQLLENISSFLGSGSVGYVLSEIKVDNVEESVNRINSLSHQNVYRFQFNEMSPNEEELFKHVFEKIQNQYHFRY